MAERSGVEMLQELIKRLDMIEKKLDVLDMNVKNILNTAKVKPIQPVEPKKETPQVKNHKIEAAEAPKAEKPGKNIMVHGKMAAQIDGQQVPLHGISVHIYNDKDVEVKVTKANRAGSWVSFLPPGKYVAVFDGEFNGKKLVPQNRNFIVPEKLPEGQKNIEVY